MIDTTYGIADELGIHTGDWITIHHGVRTVEGEVTDISEDGDFVELNGFTGLLHSLENADVSII